MKKNTLTENSSYFTNNITITNIKPGRIFS